jgi:hypothetical protein
MSTTNTTRRTRGSNKKSAVAAAMSVGRGDSVESVSSTSSSCSSSCSSSSSHSSGASSSDESGSSVDDDGNLYVIETLLKKRVVSITGQVEYLVKWEGYPKEESTWEPSERLKEDGNEDMIVEFERKAQLSKSPNIQAAKSDLFNKMTNSWMISHQILVVFHRPGKC